MYSEYFSCEFSLRVLGLGEFENANVQRKIYIFCQYNRGVKFWDEVLGFCFLDILGIWGKARLCRARGSSFAGPLPSGRLGVVGIYSSVKMETGKTRDSRMRTSNEKYIFFVNIIGE